MKYKSQYGQDKFLNEFVFKNKTNCSFLDVGANDGITLSNTYYFEKELEWYGKCFEPNPSIFNKLVLNRNCECFQVCLGDRIDKVKFTIFKEKEERDSSWINMLSGISEYFTVEYLKTISDKADIFQEIDVDLKPLDYFLKNGEIEYLSIDTEGSEYEVLNGINFDRLFIHVISLEKNLSFEQCKKYLYRKKFIILKELGHEEIIFINRKSKFFSILLILSMLITYLKIFIKKTYRIIPSSYRQKLLNITVVKNVKEYLFDRKV